MGIKTDLNLVKDDYQWLSSLFYFGKYFPPFGHIDGLTNRAKAILHGSIRPTGCCSDYPSESTPQPVS